MSSLGEAIKEIIPKALSSLSEDTQQKLLFEPERSVVESVENHQDDTWGPFNDKIPIPFE